MAINTLMTIKDALDSFVSDHEQLKRIEWEADDHREPVITSGNEFPMLFAAPIDVTIGRAMNTHTIRIYVYERINDSRDDVIENANDTSLILRDIRVWWNEYGTDDILILDDPLGTFVSDRELDNLVGYYADFTFEIPSHGRCQVPIDVAPSPSPTCDPATYTITDDAGNTLYSGTITSGGSLLQEITDSTVTITDDSANVLHTVSVNAEGSATQVISDSTVANSDNSYSASVNAEGSLALPDSQINVNSVDQGDVVSVKTIDVNITDGVDPVTPDSVSLVGNTLTIQVPSGGGCPIDSDAQAFLTATGITDATIESAVNSLVTCLKTSGIWTKLHAIYPFVGGTSTTHKFNLKNPLDTDAAFRLAFFGGWTHDANGATPNGVNAYASTFLTESTFMDVNSNGLGFYLGTNNTATSSDPVDMGAYVSATQTSLIAAKSDYNVRVNGASIQIANATRLGFYSGQRTSATLTNGYKNGVSVISGNSGGTLPNIPIYLGNISFLTDTPYSSGYTKNRFQFAFVSDGLTQAENIYLTTLVHLFQTTLGRAV